MRATTTHLRRVTAVAATLAAAAVATTATAAPAAQPGLNLQPVKAYLVQHTTRLTGFTRDFDAVAGRYYAAAKATGFDYQRLWATKRAQVRRDLERAKALWVQGNPFYER